MEDKTAYYCVACGAMVYKNTHDRVKPEYCFNCGGVGTHGMLCPKGAEEAKHKIAEMPE